MLILDGVNGRDRLELRDLFDLRKRRIFRRTVTFNKTLFKLEMVSRVQDSSALHE